MIKKVHFLSVCIFAFSCYRQEKNVVDNMVNISETYTFELANITSREEVKLAFQSIESMNSETRENQILLNEIPAPPFKEHERANCFLRMVKAVGADSVWMDSIGNVLALRKGISRQGTVVVDGHLDTVFPEETDVSVTQRGDTLFAPGISDNARSLAMILTLLKTVSIHDIRTSADLLFVGTVGEEGEGDLRGVKYLFDDLTRIRSFISIDIGEFGTVTNQGVGSVRYKVFFNGPGGHSLGDFGVVSPHFAMASALSAWEGKAANYVKSISEKTTYNIGVVGGGTSVNSIPYESWATIDIRSEKIEHLGALTKMLHISLETSLVEANKAKKKGEDLTVTVDTIGNRPPGLTDVKSPVVQRALAATAFFDQPSQLLASSTNSNVPMSIEVPAITIGQGGKSGGVHALDEWWADDEGDKAIKFALLLLLTEAGF